MDLYESFISLGRIMGGVSSLLSLIPTSALELGVVVMSVLAVGIVWHIHSERSSCAYIVAFSCYKPSEDRKMNTELFEYVICKSDPMPESLKFVVNIHIKSSLRQESYAPNSFFQGDIVLSMTEGWLEMQEAFVSTLDRLFIDNDLLIYGNSLARNSRSTEGFRYIRMDPDGNLKLYLQTPSRLKVESDFFVDFFNDICRLPNYCGPYGFCINPRPRCTCPAPESSYFSQPDQVSA